MKILLLIDKPNWAYHSIAKSLIKYNTAKNIKLSCQSIKGQEKRIQKIWKKYDLFYVMGFMTYDRIKFLPKDRTIVGVHSCHSWDNKKTQPGKKVKPNRKIIDYLNSFLRVGAVSKYLYDLFRESGVNNIYYTPNGVDSIIFKPTRTVLKDFTIGYSGTKRHDWRKGITEYIIPSAKQTNVQVNLAMRATGSYITLEKMPFFYNTLDAYVCASSSEGFSLSVLEAASCGVPIISTKVSGCIELIRDGVNGFLVDRSVNAIANKIHLLKHDREISRIISQNMRNDIIGNHCWSKKIDRWLQFLKGDVDDKSSS